jgi:hypothetical protein
MDQLGSGLQNIGAGASSLVASLNQARGSNALPGSGLLGDLSTAIPGLTLPGTDATQPSGSMDSQQLMRLLMMHQAQNTPVMQDPQHVGLGGLINSLFMPYLMAKAQLPYVQQQMQEADQKAKLANLFKYMQAKKIDVESTTGLPGTIAAQQRTAAALALLPDRLKALEQLTQQRKALTEKTTFQTEEERKKAPLELKKLDDEINKILAQTTEAGAQTDAAKARTEQTKLETGHMKETGYTYGTEPKPPSEAEELNAQIDRLKLEHLRKYGTLPGTESTKGATTKGALTEGQKEKVLSDLDRSFFGVQNPTSPYRSEAAASGAISLYQDKLDRLTAAGLNVGHRPRLTVVPGKYSGTFDVVPDTSAGVTPSVTPGGKIGKSQWETVGGPKGGGPPPPKQEETTSVIIPPGMNAKEMGLYMRQHYSNLPRATVQQLIEEALRNKK